MSGKTDKKPKVTPGSHEELILRILIHERDGAFIRSLRDKTKDLVSKDMTLSTVYAILIKLEDKKFVRHEKVFSDSSNGVRGKVRFHITNDGIAVLAEIERYVSRLRSHFTVNSSGLIKGDA